MWCLPQFQGLLVHFKANEGASMLAVQSGTRGALILISNGISACACWTWMACCTGNSKMQDSRTWNSKVYP